MGEQSDQSKHVIIADNFLDVCPVSSRKTEKTQRASFVDYVSEVFPYTGRSHNTSVLTSSNSTLTSVQVFHPTNWTSATPHFYSESRACGVNSRGR